MRQLYATPKLLLAIILSSPLFFSFTSPSKPVLKGIEGNPTTDRASFAPTATTISGTVFLDTDGSYVISDAGIGSVSLPTGASQQIYVYAEESVNDTIRAKASVAGDGTFSLTGLVDTDDYDIIVSVNDYAIGENASALAPAGHIFVADQDDDGTINLEAGDPDGTVLTSSSGTSGSMTNINFWISAQSYSVSGTVYEDNTDNSTVDGSGSNAGGLYAYLAEENSNTVYYKTTVAGDGTFSFTAGASTQYDIIISSANVNVGDAQPGYPYELPGNYAFVGDYDPESASFNNTGTIGNVDLSSLTANISGAGIGIRNGLTISGTIYNDADKATNGADGTGIGSASGSQLYMFLSDDDDPIDTFLYKTTVNGDGTYSFSGLKNLDFEVYLSAENMSVGDDVNSPHDPSLPAGWILSVEDENGSVNAASNINGNMDLGRIKQDVSNINFGLTPVNYISGSIMEDTDIIADNVGNAAVSTVEGAFLVYLLDASDNNVLDATFSLPVSSTTASDGSYHLNDVPAGTGYKIKLLEKAGFDIVADTDAVNDGLDDSDTNTSTTDNEITVDLVASETDTGNDFVVRKQEGASMDWESQGISDDAEVTDNSDYAVAGVTINVDWQVVDANGSMSPNDKVSYVTYESGQQGGDSGYLHLAMDNSENNQSDYIEVVFSFDVAVPNLVFDILDIDVNSNGTGFIDAVEVLYNGSNNVRGTSFYSISGVSVEEYTGGGLTGFQGKLPQTSGVKANGNIAFDFGATSITDITVRYYSAPGADSDPTSQLIGISDFHINPLYNISGIVYDDDDQLSDGNVDGTGIGSPDGTQLYAYLAHESGNIILAKETVAGDGTFTFSSQSSGQDYDVIISTDNLSVGAAEPSAINLPGSWDIYGEYDPESSSINSSPIGNIDLNALTSNITGVAFGIDEGTLPVELLNFSASLAKDESVIISWETLTEINNDYFNIEKSYDGEHWEILTEIKGAGNSYHPISYQTEDVNPYAGTSYYRLKQTDFNGQFSYSEVEEIYLSPSIKDMTKVYPNPTNGLLTLEGPLADIDFIAFYDIYGNEIKNTRIIAKGSNYISWDYSDLAKGIYFLLVSDTVYKVVKN
ncbi:MAG: T9SS type A sorting domain-containing protein [Bacteroidota bacterium]